MKYRSKRKCPITYEIIAVSLSRDTAAPKLAIGPAASVRPYGSRLYSLAGSRVSTKPKTNYENPQKPNNGNTTEVEVHISK